MEKNSNILNESSLDTLLGVVLDIDQKEHVLSRSLSQIPVSSMPYILDNLPVMISYIDADLKYRYINRSYKTINQCSSEDIIGKSLKSVVDTQKYKKIRSYIKNALNGESVHYVDEDSYLTFNSCPVDVYYQPTFQSDSSVSGYFEIIRIVNIKQMTNYDSGVDQLTGLFRRQSCIKALDDKLKSIDSMDPVDLYQIDISRFRDVNTAIGMIGGDRVLQLLSVRLKEYLGNQGEVYRTAGDVFTLIREHQNQEQVRAIAIADELHELIERPIDTSKYKVRLSCRIIVVKYIGRWMNGFEVLRNAEFANDHAKENNLNSCVYAKEMRKISFQKVKMKTHLGHAMKSGQIFPWYQPIVNMKNRKIVAYESLARWVDSNGKIISPSEFISFAEKSGQIVELGDRILIRALRTIKQYGYDNNHLPGYVSVNVSPIQLKNKKYLINLEKILKSIDIDPALLLVEVTEEVAASDNRHLLEVLINIKKLGVRLACDDFGAGYSSLSRLRDMPWDYIKIDRSFVSNPENNYMIDPIIQMAKGAEMKVIVEGVENLDNHEMLKNMGCDYAQGYLYGKPCETMKYGE